jgi:hypothetical protein
LLMRSRSTACSALVFYLFVHNKKLKASISTHPFSASFSSTGNI